VANGLSHGFIHVDPSNPTMFSYSDGTSFLPVGVNGHTPAVTAAYLGIPPGPQQVPAMWDSLEAHGVNTYRLFMFNQQEFADSFSWNNDEGSANLVYNTQSLDMYDLRVGKLMDRWFQQALDHNINIYLNMFVLFDVSAYPFSTSPWSSSMGGPFADINAPYASASGSGAQLERDYYIYVVSRWGAYRNLFTWEYNNEYGYYSLPPWLAMVDSVINANDPYGRPHSVSFWNYSFSSTNPVDSSAYINVTDDHFYASNGWTEFNVDSAANFQSVTRYFQYKKPVMFGEFGSSDLLYGPAWLVFIRAGYWAAFAGGGYPIIWWCGDFTSAGQAFNRAELEIVTAASKIISGLSDLPTLHPVSDVATTNKPAYVRDYAMQGDSDVVVYLRAFTSDTTRVVGLSCSLHLYHTAGKAWEATWMDPATGVSITELSGTSSSDTLTFSAPPFEADIILHVKIAGTGTAVQAGKNGAFLEFNLAQNYPNPFNPTTVIDYRLPANALVVLKVYDVLGRDVETLVDEHQSVGVHSVIFNAGNLPSGVYFYRLQAGTFIQTKKLTVLK
ncbi:MAG: T9SS type A sorting domain-containing protein, partial [Bacteroidetes bacterium]|nr:T9SS type A sorting domain-containing protein [Bacteroidota bacterium]